MKSFIFFAEYWLEPPETNLWNMENFTKDDIYSLHEKAANLCKSRNYCSAAFTIQKIVDALSTQSALNEILTRSLLRIYFLCLEQFIEGSYDSAQEIMKNLRNFYSSELCFD